MKFKTYITCLFLIYVSHAGAQFYTVPAEYSFNLLTQKHLMSADSAAQPGMQPYIPFFSDRYKYSGDSSRVFKYLKEDPAIGLIFRDHLVEVTPSAEEFTLRIDPLINFKGGRDVSDTTGNLTNNTRGVIVSGAIGEKFYFETMFAENQSVFPAYMSAYVHGSGVVPGQGRWKSFKKRGFDYAFASGLVSLQLWRNVNLQFGHGKQKVGHGYRSLLLSDNAFNYPFVRITQQWWGGKIRHTNLYASLMNLVQASAVLTPHTERLFQKKTAAFQYLEFQPFRALSIGLFQGVIFNPGDQRNRQHAGWQYLNPIIFSHWAAYGLDHPEQNVLAGADLFLKAGDKLGLYMQLMTDQHMGNGIQAGAKYFDAFRIRNLTLQLEYNNMEAEAYRRQGGASYDHYNQRLSYTPANGSELVAIADLRRNRFFINLKHHQQTFNNKNGSHGSINQVTAGYLINPSYNLNLSIGYVGRRYFYYIAAPYSDTDYLHISLTTSIYNLYYDF